jgi:hypothetical protein
VTADGIGSRWAFAAPGRWARRGPASRSADRRTPRRVAASIGRMNARAALTTLAVGRLAIGAALVAKPRSRVGAGWVGEESQRPATALLFRSVGARDMALGLGTLAAARNGSPLRPWLLGATLADVVDLVATFAAGKAVPAKGKAAIAVLAGGAIVQQLALAQRAES